MAAPQQLVHCEFHTGYLFDGFLRNRFQLKAVGHRLAALKHAENLDGRALHTVGHDLGSTQNNEFARPWYATGSPHLRIVRQ